jgi:stalled ribosome rescue protein Dom34
LTEDKLEKQKIKLTPETGFNLVGIDYFAEQDNQLYLVEHFKMYQDALNAKKDRKNPEEYFILYKGTGKEFFCR